MQTKTCTVCDIHKPVEGNFYKNDRFKDGYTTYCIKCHNEKSRNRYQNDQVRQRTIRYRSKLKQLYGITPEQLDELLNKQDGYCPICLRDLDQLKPQEVNIDHCHTTGKVRGILCNLCNVGLGSFRDNEALLLRAIGYLRGGEW